MKTSSRISAILFSGALSCGLMSGLLPPDAHGQTVRATTQGTLSATTPGTTRMAAGLQVSVRLNQNLSSKVSTEGDEWTGVLANNLVVGGHLVTPTGTQVTGVVSKAISAKRAHGSGTLEVKLTSIHGIGVDSTPVIRQGVNPALTSGSLASAGIPGEAAPAAQPGADMTRARGENDPNGQNGQTLSEARLAAGAVLSFTTD